MIETVKEVEANAVPEERAKAAACTGFGGEVV
jgi:hypothetical protein